jgi:hypothetical protein
MKITNEILHAIIHCNQKAFLKKVQENLLPKTEFQTVFETLKQKQHEHTHTKPNFIRLFRRKIKINSFIKTALVETSQQIIGKLI